MTNSRVSTIVRVILFLYVRVLFFSIALRGIIRKEIKLCTMSKRNERAVIMLLLFCNSGFASNAALYAPYMGDGH